MAGSGGSGGGSVGGGGFSGGGGFHGGGFHGGFHHGSFINHTGFNGTNHTRNTRTVKPGGRFPIFLIVVLIFVAFSFIGEANIDDDDYYFNEYMSEIVSVPYEEDPDSYEVIKKEPLSKEYCTHIGSYITDGTDNKDYTDIDNKLEQSLKKFYEATGIESHIYFLDYYYDGDLYEIALEKYYELFDDEGHLLLAFACDSFDYEYEIIIGDDTWEVLGDNALQALNDNIYNEMYEAERGSFDSIADALSEAFDYSLDTVMLEYIYIGNVVESVPLEDPSEDAETPSLEAVPDDYEQAPITDISPATTEKDKLEQFIEDEFGSHETTDELDELFDKILTSMENISLSGVLIGILILLLFGGAIIAVIIVSRKRNNYEPDTFSSNKFDDFDIDFEKKTDKYDDFLK